MVEHLKHHRPAAHHHRRVHSKPTLALKPGGEKIEAAPHTTITYYRPTSAACYVSDSYRNALFLREADKKGSPSPEQLDMMRTTIYGRIDATLQATARDLAAAWSTNSGFFLPTGFIKDMDAKLKEKFSAGDTATQVTRSLTKIEGMTFKAGRGEVTIPLVQIHNILGAALLTGKLTSEDVITLKKIFVAETSRKDTIDAANALMINHGIPIAWKYSEFEGVCIGQ